MELAIFRSVFLTKFMNSSIVSYSQAGNFEGSELTCEVNLVDCAIEGDSFTPPSIGTPVTFTYDGVSFIGLLDRYSRSHSTSGYPEYTVHLTNGIFLLEGVKIILNDYFGATSAVPNLVNVFGYLEDLSGFGGSEVNSAGISWSLIASSLTTLLNDSTGTDYGGAILHKSFKYGIDISALPAIPAYYRINSESISLLEFISEVCEAGGHNYFIRMESAPLLSGLDAVFKLYTISRLNEPVGGAVQSYIESASCVTQKEVGEELRKDSTSKFVVGANVERMWFVENDLDLSSVISGGITSDEYATFNVLPYFGVDTDGNYIVGYTQEEEPDEYYFDIDIRDVGNENLGDTYTTCFGEMKAAKNGRESWERYLSERSCNKYLLLPEAFCGTSPVVARPFVVPVPTGSAFVGGHALPFSGGSEYGDIYNGFQLMPVSKFGYSLAVSKVQASSFGITTPIGFNIDLYYGEEGTVRNGNTNSIPDSYTSVANSCAVNSYPSAGTIPYFNLYYPSSNTPNLYFLRAFQIGAVSAWSVPYARMFESDLYDLTVLPAAPAVDKVFFQNIYNRFKTSLGGKDGFATAVSSLYNAKLSNRFEYVTNDVNKKANSLYKKIKDLADNYYGKRYLVTIPSTYAAYEPESNQLRLSQVPSDAGYIDESVWSTAYANGLIPEISGLNVLLTPDERFYPFVKYEDAVTLDPSGNPRNVPYNYSSISESDKYLGNPIPAIGDGTPTATGDYRVLDLWVKCSVSDNILYRDNTTLLGPRAILDIPGSVTHDPIGNYGSVQALYLAVTRYAKGPAGAFAADAGFTNTALSNLLNQPGIDIQDLGDGSTPVVANLFSIPLKSNVLCYGPWYIAGANGPVQYEKNNDLAPWNYGGYTALDSAGFSRVNDGVTNQTFDETGSVTVAGSPTFSIGDQLIGGGPYITDINVSVGTNGINTQYSFQSWSSQRRLSKLSNFNSERIKRLSDTSRGLRRAYREGVSNGIWKNPGQFYNDLKGRFVNLEELPRRDKGTTSHDIISGTTNGYGSNVVIQPAYNAGVQMDADYENKAFMSLDGLFRPYSNLPNDKLSSLTFPEDTGVINSSYDLFPLRAGHDITIVAGSTGTQAGADGMDPDIFVNESGVPEYRGMALKGPVVIQGWGNDINDDPVPALEDEDGQLILDEDGNKQRAWDYLYNPKKWKTGLLDIKWDEGRGVWTGGAAGGGEEIWFTIDSVDCYDDGSMILTVVAIWYTGGCEKAIPGEDSYGFIQVEDVCSILSFYTADFLIGKTGRATYMYPRDGYCEPKWLIDTLCGSPQCGGS